MTLRLATAFSFYLFLICLVSSLLAIVSGQPAWLILTIPVGVVVFMLFCAGMMLIGRVEAEE